MKNYLIGFLIAVVLGCLVGTHQTGRGLLVEQSFQAQHVSASSGMLTCRYLVGFELIVQEIRYDQHNFRGRSRCPLTREFSRKDRERLRRKRQ